MKIRYQPLHGEREVELRDIIGGNPLAKWYTGDEREIAQGETVLFKELGGNTVTLDAAEAIFRHGPAFVDAKTGTNPRYACTACGAMSLDDYYVVWVKQEAVPVRFETEDGKRLCIADFAKRYPEHIPAMQARGLMPVVTASAQTTSKPQLVPEKPVPPAVASTEE